MCKPGLTNSQLLCNGVTESCCAEGTKETSPLALLPAARAVPGQQRTIVNVDPCRPFGGGSSKRPSCVLGTQSRHPLTHDTRHSQTKRPSTLTQTLNPYTQPGTKISWPACRLEPKSAGRAGHNLHYMVSCGFIVHVANSLCRCQISLPPDRSRISRAPSITASKPSQAGQTGFSCQHTAAG